MVLLPPYVSFVSFKRYTLAIYFSSLFPFLVISLHLLNNGHCIGGFLMIVIQLRLGYGRLFIFLLVLHKTTASCTFASLVLK